jgi:hypothetical protein
MFLVALYSYYAFVDGHQSTSVSQKLIITIFVNEFSFFLFAEMPSKRELE